MPRPTATSGMIFTQSSHEPVRGTMATRSNAYPTCNLLPGPSGRARSSRSNDGLGSKSWCSKTPRQAGTISVNVSSPLKNPATAASLAAFSTAPVVPPRPSRFASQLQGRKTIQVGGLESSRKDGSNQLGGDSPAAASGQVQRILNRQLHIGRTELCNHRAIDELDQRMHDRLRMDHTAIWSTSRSNSQRASMISKRLVHHRGRIDRDLRSHVPGGMGQGFGDRHFGQSVRACGGGTARRWPSARSAAPPRGGRPARPGTPHCVRYRPAESVRPAAGQGHDQRARPSPGSPCLPGPPFFRLPAPPTCCASRRCRRLPTGQCRLPGRRRSVPEPRGQPAIPCPDGSFDQSWRAAASASVTATQRG